MNKIILISLVFCVSLLYSCEEEEDCVGCNISPKIRVEFEPAFSQQRADSLLAQVRIHMQDLIDSLADSLSIEQQSEIEKKLTALRADSIVFGEEYSFFRSGQIKIDEIVAPGSEGFGLFADSVFRSFALPVNMQADTSTYYISLHGLTDTLQMYYKRDIFQSIDGLRMQITNIGVSGEVTTFDSLRLQCNNRSCSNDQTTVFIYF